VTLPETVGSPHRSWRQLREQLLGSRFGGPVRVLARGGGAGVLALALAELHATDDPGVLCPLRRLTGVPCPVCGSTTVFMELGAGHPGAAIAANPVTVLVGNGAVGGWWWRQPARRRNTVIGVAAAVSWLWQLHRFGFLSS